MPEARLKRTRETLPRDGSYQFGHGIFGIELCRSCGEYGHSLCGTARFVDLKLPTTYPHPHTQSVDDID